MKLFLTLFVCACTAFFGWAVFPDVSLVNWILGALAGILSMAIWLVD